MPDCCFCRVFAEEIKIALSSSEKFELYTDEPIGEDDNEEGDRDIEDNEDIEAEEEEEEERKEQEGHDNVS